MSSAAGSWDDGFEGAWKAFRGELATRLADLGGFGPLCLDVLAGEQDEESVAPYLRFRKDLEGGHVAAEVSSNTHLTGEHRLDRQQEARLVDIGWTAPQSEHEEPVRIDPSSFSARVETGDVEWLALMAVRALREVFGVVHPSFVRSDPPPDPIAPQDEAELAHPTCRDELVELVDAALWPVFDRAPAKDEDGDVPVVCGRSVLFVRVHRTLPVVELYAELVLGVTDVRRALLEVNIANRRSRGPAYSFDGERIVARHQISGLPFVPEVFRAALVLALEQVDELAGDLVERVGGHRFADDAPVRVPEQSRADRPSWIQTLTQLEDDQPGSVSAVLAAHIFHMDKPAILEQISRQRQAGREDLVRLLGGALRVVVESDAWNCAHP